MNRQTKTCQNCSQNFTIEPEDFKFYEKVQVPPPCFCPECRLQRRLAFRNERTLYKRKCDLCNKEIIAMYPKNTLFPVYCPSCWYSDKWDGIEYGKDYDFSKNFLTQFQDLLQKVPRLTLIGSKNINSPYVNYSMGLKDCYLLVGSSDDENCAYSYRTFDSKDSFDSFGLVGSELCYETLQVLKSHRVFFSKYSENNFDSYFLSDSKNCSYCIGCINIRNKNYQIFNQQYSKEGYES